MNFENCELTVAAGPSEVFDRAAHLRWKVFVDKMKYEPNRPGIQREETPDDAHSLHFLFSTRSGLGVKDIGCARLILPNGQDDYLFPCHRAYNDQANRGPALNMELLTRSNRVGEMSRLSVDPEYAQTTGMRHLAVFDALIVASLMAGRAVGLKAGNILVEPRMADHVTKHLGIHVHNIAPPIEHRGQRAVYLIDGDMSYHRLTPTAKKLFKWAENQLEPLVPHLEKAPFVSRLTQPPPLYNYMPMRYRDGLKLRMGQR